MSHLQKLTQDLAHNRCCKLLFCQSVGDDEAHAVYHPLLYSEFLESHPSFHLPLLFLFGFKSLGFNSRKRSPQLSNSNILEWSKMPQRHLPSNTFLCSKCSPCLQLCSHQSHKSWDIVSFKLCAAATLAVNGHSSGSVSRKGLFLKFCYLITIHRSGKSFLMLFNIAAIIRCMDYSKWSNTALSFGLGGGEEGERS